jgi:two-component system LytT family sensor kinase
MITNPGRFVTFGQKLVFFDLILSKKNHPMIPSITPGHTTRWREHEFILVTLLCIIAIAGNCWRLFEHSAAWLAEEYGRHFSDANIPFDYTRNVLLPAISIPLLIYFCYVWMNLFILPRLLQTAAATTGSFKLHFSLTGRLELPGAGGAALKRFFWGLSHTFLLIFCLGTSWGIAYFYAHRYDLPRDISNIMVMGNGLRMAINLTLAYIVYAVIRETTLRRIEAAGTQAATRINLINQVTAFLTAYFVLGGLLTYFDTMDGPMTVWYYGIIPPAILVCLSNLYWLFPLKGESRIFRGPIFRRLLLSTLAWGIPFVIATVPDRHAIVPTILGLWIAQLLITTPISWLIFQQRKDKIMQIRGLETALGQSKADLQFLRSQINPHFLFNVLNTLYGTALHENAGRTAGGIQQLGDMMRFMLHENNLDRIAMSKEIEYVKNYIALQQLRTEASPSINIETEIDEEFPDCRIAPMLVIPFLENAFKHGISLRESSWIKLNLHCDGKRFHFELRNSVHLRQGNDPEKGRSGVGLKNVLHRLKLIYPDKHEFFMHQDEKEFFVQLAIQL